MRTRQSKRPDRQPLSENWGKGMVAPETSLQAKFDLFVGEPNESGCWIWLGRIDKYGYGRLSHKSQFWLAHRASFVLSIGEIPEAMFVLHRCDVRHCVNPDHLFLGTNADNMADKTAKGRQVIGSQSCWAKLNEQKVGEIREKYYLQGVSRKALCVEYKVADVTIWNVIIGKRWKHVPMPKMTV